MGGKRKFGEGMVIQARDDGHLDWRSTDGGDNK